MKIRLWALPAFLFVVVLCLGAAAPVYGAQLQMSNGSACPGFEGDPTGGVIGQEGVSSGGASGNPPDNSPQPEDRIPIFLGTININIVVNVYQVPIVILGPKYLLLPRMIGSSK
jgi:hypothetical protein